MLARVVRVEEEEWAVRALGAGFVAVGLMSLVFMIGYTIAAAIGATGSGPIASWFAALSNNFLTRQASDQLILTIAINCAFGLAWALIYAAFFARRLSGPGWRRGMMFALLPWVLSLTLFFPMVGAGFVGLALNAGPLPIIGNLILHLVYGGALGALYALPVAATDDSDEQRHAMIGAERGVMWGLLLGILIGAITGGLFGALAGGSILVGLVAGGAAGGALGVIAGSLLGLSSAEHATSK
jgi:hypothetical protein